MSNELLWLIFMIADLSIAVIVFRLFGKRGLFMLIAANIIICNIQVLKTVQLFGLTATLGNILYGSIFFSTDVISEIYGKKDARTAVFIGFASLLLMTLYMQFSLLFTPAAEDFADQHLQALFGFMPRIALGSLIAYLVSQLHDVWAFHYWKDKTSGKHLWLRNNMSTLVSQALDSLIFCLIAFVGLYSTEVWLEILLTTYLFKLIVAIFDTPFIYIAKRIGEKKKVPLL
ncbi:MAG TPA: queuosine precursor transporter [Thermotogota bacterium]|nr:queuosine precursor transporter [Thermotogota bacterium]HPJ87690.1 queuosine precursor transporter [Thermotogota bacterium]HPR94871.1 queuosine precursor transporter [Thermotogota bacterium]